MKWTAIASEVVFRCRRFNVRRDLCRSESSGNVHEFQILELSDWVAVVPVTVAGDLVMVRQFRHGSRALSLEFPAGILDPEDDSPSTAALRELREETGYSSHRIDTLGVVHPNPGLQTNRCHLYVAHEVVLAGPTQWDAVEELTIERVPVARVPDLIARGEICSALALLAFYLFSARAALP